MAQRMSEIQRNKLSYMPGTRLESREQSPNSRLSSFYHLKIGEQHIFDIGGLLRSDESDIACL